MNHKFNTLLRSNTEPHVAGDDLLLKDGCCRGLKGYHTPLWNAFTIYKAGKCMSMLHYVSAISAEGLESYPDIARKGTRESQD